jgi:hypothetical protein
MATETHSHILFSISFLKIVPFMRLRGKYGAFGQTAGYSTIRRMRVACLVNKATDTHPEHLTFFHGNSDYANAP